MTQHDITVQTLQHALLAAWGPAPDGPTQSEWNKAAHDYAKICANTIPANTLTQLHLLQQIVAKATSQNWQPTQQTWNNTTLTPEETQAIDACRTPSKASDQPQWQAGDHVTTPSGNPATITQHNGNGIYTARKLDGSVLQIHGRNLTTWKPRPGEWIETPKGTTTLTGVSDAGHQITPHGLYNITAIKPAQPPTTNTLYDQHGTPL